MRCGILLVVVALALLVFGGQEVHDAYSFRHPVTMSSDEFTKSPPQSGWYHVTNCHLNVVEMLYMVKKSKYDTGDKPAPGSETFSSIYIPIHYSEDSAVGNEKSQDVSALVETSDEKILETAREINRQGGVPEAEAAKWAKDHVDEWLLARDVTGMVKAGINSDSDTREKLSKVHGSLTPNFVIIEEGKKPSWGLSLGLMLGGVVVGIAAALYWLSRLAGSRGASA